MLALCIASICSSVICDLCCCCCCARSRSAIICCMAICCWYFLRSSSNACCCAWNGDCGAPGGAAAAPMRSWGRSRPPGDVWMYELTSRSAICIVDAKSPPSSSSLVLGM